MRYKATKSYVSDKCLGFLSLYFLVYYLHVSGGKPNISVWKTKNSYKTVFRG
jgi:hypothetical protein